MFPAEKDGILNSDMRYKGRTNYITRNITLLLLERKLCGKLRKVLGKNLGIILTLGNASAEVIGIYFCIRTIKLIIIDTVIYGYTLHTIYGWSIHLIEALWDSVTNLLLHLANGATKKKEAGKNS